MFTSRQWRSSFIALNICSKPQSLSFGLSRQACRLIPVIIRRCLLLTTVICLCNLLCWMLLCLGFAAGLTYLPACAQCCRCDQSNSCCGRMVAAPASASFCSSFCCHHLCFKSRHVAQHANRKLFTLVSLDRYLSVTLLYCSR